MTSFTKMHGCGNDYIFFNCFETMIENPSQLAITLSDRNRSIGGDGIVLIMPSDIADAKMRMFNADGSEGLMCGNSVRCVGKYLFDRSMVQSTEMSIETLSGVRKLVLTVENGKAVAAQVDMGIAEFEPEKIPVNLTGSMIVARQVNLGGKLYEITCVSMGNPHVIIFHDDIDHSDLHTVNSKLEASDLFPEGHNLGLVQVIDRNNVRMRVWERGTGETMASGTGACAAAVAAVLMGYADKGTNVNVEVRGGILTVKYTDDAVYMTGDCVTIYEGVVEL